MSKKLKLSKLIPDDRNNNRHTAYGMELLEKSVNKVGIIESITVSNDDKIISGNARHEVIGKNFDKEALVIETDGTQPIIIKRTDIESDTKKFYEASILANTTAKKNIDFDIEVIESLSEEYDIDIEDLGVDTIEDEHLEAEEDDFSGTPPKEPITVLGDLYEIGEHRLLCGDSTCSDTVAKLMNGEKADMVFTDPPYGMFLDADYSGMKSKFKGSNGGAKYENVIGDHEDFNPDFINNVFASFGYCKEIFLWGADYYADLLPNRNDGSWVVWDKRGDESADKMFGSTFELCWSKARHKRMLARIKWAGIFGMEKEHDKKRCHPTQKPVELINWFFDYYSMQDKKIVVDLFGGSGSTLIACEKTNRHARLMELDPKYCDVIVARMINLDSTLPIKRNGTLLSKSEIDKFTQNTNEAK